MAGILALTHGDSGALNTLGVVFALAAGSLWGIYILVNARVGRAFEGGTGLALAMVVASLVTLPFGIAQAGGQLLALHSLAVGAAVAMLRRCGWSQVSRSAPPDRRCAPGFWARCPTAPRDRTRS